MASEKESDAQVLMRWKSHSIGVLMEVPGAVHLHAMYSNMGTHEQQQLVSLAGIKRKLDMEKYAGVPDLISDLKALFSAHAQRFGVNEDVSRMKNMAVSLIGLRRWNAHGVEKRRREFDGARSAPQSASTPLPFTPPLVSTGSGELRGAMEVKDKVARTSSSSVSSPSNSNRVPSGEKAKEKSGHASSAPATQSHSHNAHAQQQHRLEREGKRQESSQEPQYVSRPPTTQSPLQLKVEKVAGPSRNPPSKDLPAGKAAPNANKRIINGPLAGTLSGKKKEIETLWAVRKSLEIRSPRLFFVKYKGYSEEYNEWLPSKIVPEDLQEAFYAENMGVKNSMGKKDIVVRPSLTNADNFCVYCPNYIFEGDRHIQCTSCNTKGHMECIMAKQMYSEAKFERCAARDDWECINCIRCQVCKTDDEPDSIVICDGCDRGFHTICMQNGAPQAVDSAADFYCKFCIEEGVPEEEQAVNQSPAGGSFSASKTSVAPVVPAPMEVSEDDDSMFILSSSSSEASSQEDKPKSHSNGATTLSKEEPTRKSGTKQSLNKESGAKTSMRTSERSPENRPLGSYRSVMVAAGASSGKEESRAGPAENDRRASKADSHARNVRHDASLLSADARSTKGKREKMKIEERGPYDDVPYQVPFVSPEEETLEIVRIQRDHLFSLLMRYCEIVTPRSSFKDLTLEDLCSVHPQHLIGLETVANEPETDDVSQG